MKSNQISNRLLFKIDNDSIFTFDSGKEEWKGSFKTGFGYIKHENKLSIPSIGAELEYSNGNQLTLKDKNETLYFKKTKLKKINVDKFEKFISENIFVSNFNKNKRDTISFQVNRTSPKYSFNNVDVYFIRLKNSKVLLYANFKGENIYEIASFGKRQFSINQNSKHGMKKIDFEVLKLNNLDKFRIEEESMMLE
ncbi:hypothetical protein ACJRPK_16085 [Aquimarina sp. 2-A2]|uniref:hypothetical protein n=1 Tax=Aquimarina sp. 2-A2 TaxID=3382644 RepID=UPI00387F2456